MNLKDIKQNIDQDIYQTKLEDIYGADNYQSQKERYLHSITRFEELYGVRDIIIASAPGRSEISGNHTDHQGGQVLAASINLDVLATVAKNDNNIVSVYSEGYGSIEISLDDLNIVEEEFQTTKSIIKGVIYFLKEDGYNIGAFDAYITSDVLGGSGLSSSASFEALIGTIISSLFNDDKISPVEIAIIGQKAENIYFGKPCGLMDQVACSLGNLVHIDFSDKDNPKIEPISYDFSKSGYSLCIVDTNASHADLTDDYASIPHEMKTVAQEFGQCILSQVNPEDFYISIARIRGKVSDRAILRAHHYYCENFRVETQSKYLQEGNIESFLRLVKESGDSSFKYLQNIYSIHDYDNQAVSLALALSEKVLQGHGVSRVHGGGFAGTIQVFVKNDFVQEYKRQIEDIFGHDRCHVLNIRKYGGIRVI